MAALQDQSLGEVRRGFVGLGPRDMEAGPFEPDLGAQRSSANGLIESGFRLGPAPAASPRRGRVRSGSGRKEPDREAM